MNSKHPGQSIAGFLTSRSTWQTRDQDGMALVLALLLGIVMLTGISGLLARQLMSRRLSAESGQQMAEGSEQWLEPNPQQT